MPTDEEILAKRKWCKICQGLAIEDGGPCAEHTEEKMMKLAREDGTQQGYAQGRKEERELWTTRKAVYDLQRRAEKAEAELNTVRNVAIKQLILDKKNLENALGEVRYKAAWINDACIPGNKYTKKQIKSVAFDTWEIAKKALQAEGDLK